MRIMKKLAALLIGSALVMGAAACSDTSKTSSDAPNSAEKTAQAPTNETVKANQDDAASQVRKNQLNSDIRAREQRNNMTGGDADRANGDLSSEVRSKLEANIPKSNLAVTATDGAVVVTGSVTTQAQLDKIKTLAEAIKGVKSVNVAAKVAAAMPEKK
jgi:hyperosmotically inducible periplasmic protein